MRKTYKKVTLDGKRIKQEMSLLKNGSGKNGRFVNSDLAKTLGFSNEKSVSKYLNGTPIDIDRAELFAKYCGIRLDYIIGRDDWRTEDDMTKYARIDDIESFNTCKAYLETLGLKLEPSIMSYGVSITKLYEKWDTVSEYLTDECRNEIAIKYDFTLESREFHKKYFLENMNIRLKKPFDAIGISFFEVGKCNTSEFPQRILHIGDNKTLLGENIEYSLGYIVSYNGIELRNISIRELQEFISKLDKFAKCCIESFLLPE